VFFTLHKMKKKYSKNMNTLWGKFLQRRNTSLKNEKSNARKQKSMKFP
jgi:hypothetical protein